MISFAHSISVSRFASAAMVVAMLLCALAAPQASATTPGKPVVTRAKGVADFNKDGSPNVQSSAVLVFDEATGQPLFSKNADTAVPIASITKIMTAMVVLEAKLNPDEAIVIDKADIDTLKGSSSRLPVGSAFRREDLMRLALMASDNRAAAALGRTFPGGSVAFVDAMNAKSKSLGLTRTNFVDATGLAPGNVASPTDLAKLVAAASVHREIREFSTQPELHVKLPTSGRQLGFNNTNSLVRSQGWDIALSKTGYISEAGKCLVMKAMIGNNPVIIVLMDSWGKLTRVGDANRIKKWIESPKFPGFRAKKEG